MAILSLSKSPPPLALRLSKDHLPSSPNHRPCAHSTWPKDALSRREKQRRARARRLSRPRILSKDYSYRLPIETQHVKSPEPLWFAHENNHCDRPLSPSLCPRGPSCVSPVTNDLIRRRAGAAVTMPPQESPSRSGRLPFRPRWRASIVEMRVEIRHQGVEF